MEGAVDYVSATEIAGWIASHDQDKALESVFVETDRMEKLEFKAIVFRPDIADLFASKKKFGFAIPLSSLRYDSEIRITDRNNRLLENGVIRMSIPPEPATPGDGRCRVFLHIQKTAGTAFASALTSQLAQSETCLFYQGHFAALDWDEANSLPEHQCRAFRQLIGHTFFGLDGFLRQPTRYYAFMREPVARVRSHYWHYRTNGFDGLEIDGEFVPLHRIVNEGLTDEFDNLQTRMIAGVGVRNVPLGSMSDDVVELAMMNIDRFFDFVGMTENFDAHSKMMLETMGLEPVSIGRHNVTNVRRTDENDEGYRLIDWAKVAEINRFDQALYQRIAARHRDRQSDAPERKGA
jgi:hypothetical protein